VAIARSELRSRGRAIRRVVIVSPHSPEFVGGVERSCALLASVLERRGLDVDVVWPRREARRWVYRVGLGSLSHSRRLGRSRALLGADLIVTTGIHGYGFPRAVPRIHVYHGTLAEMTRAYGPWLPRRERARRRFGGGAAETLAGRHATVVCVSESTAEEVARHYRLEVDAIVPNGIALDVFAPRPRTPARVELGLPADERLALFAGRLNFSKGGTFMRRACERAGYRLMVASPTASPGAINLGALDTATLATAYAAADCVMLPSLYEACSYVVLEALACERPLLSTPVGSVPSLLQAVPEYRALCIRPDESDLVAKLIYLRDTDTSALTEAGRAWVTEHGRLDRFAERWMALVDRVELAARCRFPLEG
jgi:glycosyltransferase involved in cell wall biosynthesis